MEAQSMEPMYLSIQPKKTGEHIRKLLLEQGYTIREIQGAFGFENPQAIYKMAFRQIVTQYRQFHYFK